MPRAGKCDLFVACVTNAEGAEGAESAEGAQNNPTAIAFALVQQARDAGLSAEMDHQGRSLKSQFKLADKLGARYVAVLGPDELANGVCTLRNMATHEQTCVAQEDVVATIS